MKTVLVTGGTGYIGSHAVVELVDKGYSVVIADSCVNSSRGVVNKLESITGRDLLFYETDLNDTHALDHIFSNHNFDTVLHFAGYKAVGESVEKPMLYYNNNVQATLSLLEVMKRHQVRSVVFSSSCTVYGNPEAVPVSESARLRPENPYGRSKYMIEQILIDLANTGSGWSISILRYFNPIGAHPSGEIGEDPLGTPNNLLPFIAQVAVGRRDKLSIFGNDYPTKDGTCVRDYIHIVDLAKGHLKAMEHIQDKEGVFVHNLGTGKGYSVLEVVKAFEKISGAEIPFEFADRRAGDAAVTYANSQKAYAELNWETNLDIYDMCRDMWRWQQQNPHGYHPD